MDTPKPNVSYGAGGHPIGGYGRCTTKGKNSGCDCGTKPCGFYVWNHSSTAVINGQTFQMPGGMRKFRDPKKPREATHLKHEKPWVEDNENTEGLLDEGKASDETYFCL
jgi:bacillopeptidase F (M6 metalloprotease family)